jgi:hypothetical protein
VAAATQTAREALLKEAFLYHDRKQRHQDHHSKSVGLLHLVSTAQPGLADMAMFDYIAENGDRGLSSQDWKEESGLFDNCKPLPEKATGVSNMHCLGRLHARHQGTGAWRAALNDLRDKLRRAMSDSVFFCAN